MRDAEGKGNDSTSISAVIREVEAPPGQMVSVESLHGDSSRENRFNRHFHRVVGVFGCGYRHVEPAGVIFQIECEARLRRGAHFLWC